MESFCHVGGRHGGHEHYGHVLRPVPVAQNCAFCGKIVGHRHNRPRCAANRKPAPERGGRCVRLTRV